MRIVAVIALAVCAALTLPQLATAKERLPKDVVSGWRFGKSLAQNYKRYGYQVVRKKDGHPVRAGGRSIRFEVRPGDCGWNDGWNDCKKDRRTVSTCQRAHRVDNRRHLVPWMQQHRHHKGDTRHWNAYQMANGCQPGAEYNPRLPSCRYEESIGIFGVRTLCAARLCGSSSRGLFSQQHELKTPPNDSR